MELEELVTLTSLGRKYTLEMIIVFIDFEYLYDSNLCGIIHVLCGQQTVTNKRVSVRCINGRLSDWLQITIRVEL